MNCVILQSDSQGISQASQMILNGGVVAFPTETFYGLGADALNEKALKKIFQVKGRYESKPLPLLIANRTWLSGLVKKISPRAESLMERFWPGPLTLVFEASPHLPNLLTANTGKVGIRISSHPIAQALVQAVGRPITGTSANRSGYPSASISAEVLRALGEQVEAIIDGGKTKGGLGSTVLDVSGSRPIIIRPGAVSREELASFLDGP